jgi:hypothetical protein
VSLPTDYVRVFAFTTVGVVAAQRIQVVVAVLAGRAVVIVVTPGVLGDVFLLEIGPVPVVDAGRLDRQRDEAFLGRRVTPDLEVEQVQPCAEFLDLQLRGVSLGAAQVFQDARADQPCE